MKLLIVDDEPLAREGLRREVSRLPGITVVGECGTRADAVDVIVERRPDVVLLDIQLGRGTAFEIIEEIGVDAMPLVIFVTAYDRHALKAFEVHAGARSYLMRVTMDRLEQRLAGRGDFIRVRRSALINVRAVATLERYAKGMYTLRLTSGATITSSRYHQAALRELIKNQSR